MSAVRTVVPLYVWRKTIEATETCVVYSGMRHVLMLFVENVLNKMNKRKHHQVNKTIHVSLRKTTIAKKVFFECVFFWLTVQYILIKNRTNGKHYYALLTYFALVIATTTKPSYFVNKHVGWIKLIHSIQLVNYLTVAYLIVLFEEFVCSCGLSTFVPTFLLDSARLDCCLVATW